MKKWNENEVGKLERLFEFKNFSEALQFVNQVGEIAESNNHHPDILLHDYKKVTITLFTHDENSVTEKDLKLAELIEESVT